MSFGTYPGISLKEARKKAVETKKLILDDIDPIENKKLLIQKQSNSFEIIAEKWLDIMATEWKDITLNFVYFSAKLCKNIQSC